MRANYTQLPNWPGEIVAIFGGGPSLTPAQVSYCRNRCRTIAINYAFTLAPWADWLHGYDQWFWRKYKEASSFPGLKTSGQAALPSILQLPMQPRGKGLPFADPTLPVCMGYDSGYQSIQLAALTNPAEIWLFGFDCQSNGRWHNEYPQRSYADYTKAARLHRELAPLLAARGCQVTNYTEDSAIDAYPKKKLEEELL